MLSGLGGNKGVPGSPCTHLHHGQVLHSGRPQRWGPLAHSIIAHPAVDAPPARVHPQAMLQAQVLYGGDSGSVLGCGIPNPTLSGTTTSMGAGGVPRTLTHECTVNDADGDGHQGPALGADVSGAVGTEQWVRLHPLPLHPPFIPRQLSQLLFGTCSTSGHHRSPSCRYQRPAPSPAAGRLPSAPCCAGWAAGWDANGLSDTGAHSRLGCRDQGLTRWE